MKSIAALFFTVLSFAVAAADPAVPEAFSGKPLWILEGGSAPERIDGSRQLTGTIVAHPAEATAIQTKTFAESRREGHQESGMTIRYELPPDFPGGKFRMAALYATGGHVTLLFTLRQTDGEGRLLAESNCRLRSVSWQNEYWMAKEPVELLPGKSVLELTMSGRSSNVKKLTRVILAAEEDRRYTAEQAALRQRLSAAKTEGRGRTLLLLEDGAPEAGDALFGALEPLLPEQKVSVEYYRGETAAELKNQLELDRLPAAVLCDADHRVLNTLTDPARSAGFFRPGPVKNPEAPQVKLTAPGAEMLVAGTWAGPAGLSLMGLDAEAVAAPEAGDAVPVMYWDRRLDREWRAVSPGPGRRFLIEQSSNTYVWPRGSAYAFCYLRAERETELELTVEQSGSETSLRLDGVVRNPVKVEKIDKGVRKVADVTDQGNPVEVEVRDRALLSRYKLRLSPGTHRLLLKFVMEHRKGDVFDFALTFGAGSDAVRAALSDPDGNAKLHRELNGLTQRVSVDAPANLPRPGEPLKIATRLSLPGPKTTGQVKDWPVQKRLGELIVPVRPFRAVLKQRVTDYDGKVIRSFRTPMEVPGEVTLDFGPAPETGYYAIQSELETPEGVPIGTLYPDGFSVVSGTSARKERRDALKMVSVHYWVSPGNVGEMTDWMVRTGILHHIGSGIGYRPEVQKAFEDNGLTLTADFVDPHGRASREERFQLAKAWGGFTDRFKSFNEIDICRERPSPENWVARTREEYEAVKAANPKAEFTGGSYVRPGVGDWFPECVKLGLDRWVDRWDVHAYPQKAPRLGARYIGNSSREDAAGLDLVYSRLGRKNPHPFVMGETGARCGHGDDARRWQAETTAKMLAWALSRPDYSAIAFLVPWWKMQDGWDIPVAHHPAEAAMYTAGILIDGYPAEKLDGYPAEADVARFGQTVMAWTTGKPGPVTLHFSPGTPLVKVDVVGRVEKLSPNTDGSVEVKLSDSPVYVLPEAEYRRLSR